MPGDFRLFGPHRTLLYYLKVVNEDKVIIVSQTDAACMRKNYAAKEYHNLYHLAHGFYDQERPVSKELLKKAVKIKFLNGESAYTKEELVLLEEWIKTWGVKRMHEFYLNHILDGFPVKRGIYSKSTLQKLFKKLKSK